MLGIVTAFGALFLELLVFTFFNLKIDSSYAYANSLNLAIILSVFLEESVKIVILFQILKKTIQEKTEPRNIFLSAVMAGLGFSLTEIFFNLFNPQINRSLSWVDMAGLLSVHTGTFALLGYILAKKIPPNFLKFILFLPLTFSFHLLYNSLVIYQWNSGFYFLFLVLTFLALAVFLRDLKKSAEEKNLPKSEIGL